MNPLRTMAAGVLAGGLLLATAACDDEDGDGAVTDEEIQDVEDTGEDVVDEVGEEIDGQSTGTDEDGE